MNNHKNFILEFLFSIAIQCSTSVIRKKYSGSCKIHKYTKIFTLENIRLYGIPVWLLINGITSMPTNSSVDLCNINNCKDYIIIQGTDWEFHTEPPSWASHCSQVIS